MMRAVAELGELPTGPVFVSLEPVMGCGMGGCYSCVVPVRRGRGAHFVRSCLDGPVFEARTWSGIGCLPDTDRRARQPAWIFPSPSARSS